MHKIKVLIKNNQTEVKIPTGIRMLVRRCCNAVLVYEKFDHDVEVSVSFVSADEIKKLNEQFRGKDAVTDVLSFPLGADGKYDVNNETGAYLLGDIVICMQRAVQQAENYGHSLKREIGFLTVHSTLHLLGYDHEGNALESRIMREKEESVLSSLGIARQTSYITGKE